MLLIDKKLLKSFILIILCIGCSSLQSNINEQVNIYASFLNVTSLNEGSDMVNSKIFSGETKDVIVKIQVFSGLNKTKSEDILMTQLFVLNSLYREVHSPYPGEISNKIACPNEFKPVKKVINEKEYYLLYSTERLTFGACSWDIIKYQTALIYYYCPKYKEFYKIRLFFPLKFNESLIQKEIESIKCK